MPSSNFVNLSLRLLYLKATLPAPSATLMTTPLSQKDADCISFCAVMAGAACESFIEEVSLKLAESAERKFATSSALGRVGKHLCVFPFVEAKQIADIQKMAALYGATGFDIRVSKKLYMSSSLEIGKLLDLGYKRFKNQVNNNHGFGPKYQFRLLSAIGADLTSLNPTFVSRIAQMMDLRGEAVHKAVVAAKTMPTSADMCNWIDDLIVGFRDLDKLLSKLESKVQ